MGLCAAVRYSVNDMVSYFAAPSEELREGEAVIVRTDRGLEWGTMVSAPQQGDVPELCGEILRKATEQDARKERDIVEGRQKEEFQVCRQLIAKHNLPMKLAKVEHLFGGNKIIFFFLADGRVDFRALVKDLAKRYRCRIEMRQIGVRDEARLLGDYGPCGRGLCCRTFLRILKPVPMKVAKSQKSTLDPAKISGRCGRLKCCLKFENTLYAELKKALPHRGATVRTPLGTGVVMGYQIIEQMVNVKFPDETERTLPLSEVEGYPTAGN